MLFRDRLLATIDAIQPLLAIEGLLIAGSEVPNLLEPDAAATLVVSEDLDLAVPVLRHLELKEALGRVVGFHPSPHEPSVWLPNEAGPLEVNFIGMDPDANDPTALSVLEDSELPLMVFGALSLLRPGPVLSLRGARVPLPRVAGLVLEKLLTERSGVKGERDLLVALAMLVVASEADLEEIERGYRDLPRDLRAEVRRNLIVLSMAQPTLGMPDPRPLRGTIADLAQRLEATK